MGKWVSSLLVLTVLVTGLLVGGVAEAAKPAGGRLQGLSASRYSMNNGATWAGLTNYLMTDGNTGTGASVSDGGLVEWDMGSDYLIQSLYLDVTFDGIGQVALYRDGSLVGTYTPLDDTVLNITPVMADTVRWVGQTNSGSVWEIEAYELLDSTAPATPSGLSATAGLEQVAVSWSASPDADVAGYRVRYSTNNGTSWTTVDRGALLSWTHAPATAGTAVEYQVQAYDGAGNSSTWSGSVSAIPYATPGVLTLTATANDGTVSLSWSSASGSVTGYRVFRGGDQIVVLASGTLTYEDSGLTNGTQYTYYVEAYGIGGTSQSDTVNATPQVAPITAKPVLTAQVGSTQVLLSWAVVSGAGGYKVMQDGVQVADVTAVTATISGLVKETGYSFVVTAYNVLGDGPPSDPLAVTTTAVGWLELGQEAAAGGNALLDAAETIFAGLWPKIVALIAVVFLAYWVIGRVRKGAIGAK